MDDLLALDGGSSATRWQKRHAKRKTAEARKKLSAIIRAERKADLRKRTKKWRLKWAAEKARRMAAGLPPPSRHTRPRDMSKPQWIDMTGWRFGRLTVLRIAPVSSNGKNHGRRWWVKCDCGSAEKRVAGTNLRQGILQSCGCIKGEKIRAYWSKGEGARKIAERRRLAAAPLSIRLADLRRRIRGGKIRLADSKLISEARRIVLEQEIRIGVRGRRNHAKRPVGLLPAPVGVPPSLN